MRVNVCTVNSGWILQKISERITQSYPGNDISFSLSKGAPPVPDYTADVNYYVDIQNCFFNVKTKCDIGLFTHADLDSKKWMFDMFMRQGCFGLDAIIAMGQRYADMMIELGYPKENVYVLPQGLNTDYFPMKKIKIGISGRGGWPGYGHFFLQSFFSKYNTKNFEFHFLGSGWDSILTDEVKANTNIFIRSNESYDFYPEFYQSLDYLLVAGLWAGGPICIQEGLATGLPIISADIGYTNHEYFPDYVFKPGNESGLLNILREIEKPYIERRAQVEDITWENHTARLVDIIKKVKKI